jgi:AmmeMemoRadiSam system protein A
MSLSDNDRRTLIGVARQAIEYGLHSAGRGELSVDPLKYNEALRQKRATFVTLQLTGNLRGCIGTLEARQPLVNDVAHNAHAAAFSDPRFFPLSFNEYEHIDIHISILSPATPMSFQSENELLSQLQPGVDGLVLQENFNKGTFLPSVWETLPDPRQFLAHLKQKAGLPQNYWSDTLRVYRYTTESFGESDII